MPGVRAQKVMSDNWLQFIPAEPNFRPSADAAERARELLVMFVPDSDEVSAKFEEAITFFDPGANWSGVACPTCGSDVETWWQEAMTASYKDGFRDLGVLTPCCGAKVSLNDLRYVWPAAFGRFALEAMNPNVRDLQPGQEEQLSQALGCELRKVWVHR